MKTLFSTEDVHPRDRFDYWHSVACKNIVAHDSTPECRQNFKAEIQSALFADLGVVLFENSPMSVARKAAHVKIEDSNEIFICQQIAGTLNLEQEGRGIVLNSGDFALIDPRFPYSGTFSMGSKLLVLKVPGPLLEARVGNTRGMVSRLIKPSEAEFNLTSNYLAMLPTYVSKLQPANEEIVKIQVLDLVALSIATAMKEGSRASSARSLVSMRVCAAIEAQLVDPAIDASTIAGAVGISVRYANAVLAEENTTIMRLVSTKRLERCRRALEDPAQARRSVSEIAYGWGFSDMTHFGRKFKAAYGIRPSEYRKRHRQLIEAGEA